VPQGLRVVVRPERTRPAPDAERPLDAILAPASASGPADAAGPVLAWDEPVPGAPGLRTPAVETGTTRRAGAETAMTLPAKRAGFARDRCGRSAWRAAQTGGVDPAHTPGRSRSHPERWSHTVRTCGRPRCSRLAGRTRRRCTARHRRGSRIRTSGTERSIRSPRPPLERSELLSLAIEGVIVERALQPRGEGRGRSRDRALPLRRASGGRRWSLGVHVTPE